MYYSWRVDEDRFHLEALDDADPFEIDEQAAHLFKHAPYGIDDIYEVWESDPIFGCYQAAEHLADQHRKDR